MARLISVRDLRPEGGIVETLTVFLVVTALTLDILQLWGPLRVHKAAVKPVANGVTAQAFRVELALLPDECLEGMGVLGTVPDPVRARVAAHAVLLAHEF